MTKKRVAVLGTTGKSILIDDSLGPRLTAVEEALASLKAARSVQLHSSLTNLQVGNDHPQYPLKLARETIKGQWDFTQQVWASLGTEAAPGYAFTQLTGSGLFGFAGTGDQFYPAVSILVHCDGTNGSTTFTDSGPGALTCTANGSVTVATAQKKFGTASANFPAHATAAYVSVPITAGGSLDMGSATAIIPFTAEGWFYGTDIATSTGVLIGCRDAGNSSGFVISVASSGTLGANIYGASACSPAGPSGIVNGQWYHFALCRYANGDYKLFLDGVSGATSNAAAAATPFSEATLRIGADRFSGFGGGTYWAGYIDEVRITKGVARYSSNFTPPSVAFLNSGSPSYVSVSSGAYEKYRFPATGELGIGGASYGNAGDYVRSAGSGSSPTWTAPQALTKVDDTNVTLTLSGSPSTALFGATLLTLGWTGQLAVTRGGTGLSAVTQGDILYSSAANTLAALAKNASATRYLSNTGASNNPAWAQVDLTNGVTGVLPAANLPGSFSGFANPTASVGLTAVNGTATTAMRSDGAPALSQSISPNMTGNWTFTPASGHTVIHAGNLRLDVDNLEVALGASQDLRMYHDGTNNVIRSDGGAKLLGNIAGGTISTLASRFFSLGNTSPASGFSGSSTMINVKGIGASEIGSVKVESFGTTNLTKFEMYAADSLAEAGIFVETLSRMVFYTNGTERFRVPPDYNAIRLAAIAGDPATPTNGDMWYNSTTGKFRGRAAGVNVDFH